MDNNITKTMSFYIPVLIHLKVDHCSHTKCCRIRDLAEISDMEKLMGKKKKKNSITEKIPVASKIK